LIVADPGIRARLIVPLVVALSMLMETMDATVLATALPVLAQDLSVPVLSLKLALSTYLVAFAAMVPVSGWLADRFGARRVFVAAMVVFLAGSALASIQTGLPGLVFSRAVQGAGGAMMVPVGRLIVLRGVAKEDMVQALAWVTVPALMGPAIGPLLGAVVTDTLGWRWIFLINLPVGLVAIGLALWLIPRVPAEPVTPLDRAGFVLSGFGLGAGLFGLSTLGEHLVSTPAALAAMAGGVVLLGVYRQRAKGREDALLDPRLFRHHTLSVGIVSGTIFRMSGGAAAFLLPLLFQIGLGLSIVTSGILSGLFALGGLTMRALAPRVLDGFGFRHTLIAGTLTEAAAFVGLGFVQSADYRMIVPLVVIAGLAQALVFTGLNGLVFADATEEEMGRATGLAAVTQQIGLTAGIAVAALVLQAGGDPAPTAPPLLGHFPAAFWTMAGVLLLTTATLLRLRKGEAASLRHHPAHAHRQHDRV
jgi:EmrB/QacA subfamily drug resistance transporter